jgi:hypothetical protein
MQGPKRGLRHTGAAGRCPALEWKRVRGRGLQLVQRRALASPPPVGVTNPGRFGYSEP